MYVCAQIAFCVLSILLVSQTKRTTEILVPVISAARKRRIMDNGAAVECSTSAQNIGLWVDKIWLAKLLRQMLVWLAYSVSWHSIYLLCVCICAVIFVLPPLLLGWSCSCSSVAYVKYHFKLLVLVLSLFDFVCGSCLRSHYLSFNARVGTLLLWFYFQTHICINTYLSRAFC